MSSQASDRAVYATLYLFLPSLSNTFTLPLTPSQFWNHTPKFPAVSRRFALFTRFQIVLTIWKFYTKSDHLIIRKSLNLLPPDVSF